MGRAESGQRGSVSSGQSSSVSRGYMEQGIQTPMAQGRSTKIISMIKWIRTSRLVVKKELSLSEGLD